MNVDPILDRARSLQTQMDALGVVSPGLLGPTARGRQREDSHVDVLVAFEGLATFDRSVSRELLLENALATRGGGGIPGLGRVIGEAPWTCRGSLTDGDGFETLRGVRPDEVNR